jgi:RNA polymerase sigma factor for flagellar operon FliA
MSAAKGEGNGGSDVGVARDPDKLSDRDVQSLWRRFKEYNDPTSRDQLILNYAPLVKYVAGRMGAALPSHVDEADLISYGLLGLINAVERFDLKRRIKFETYAVTRIKGAIIDELRSLDWVPRSVRARAREIERTSAELEHKLHRAPTDAEMATALGVTTSEFQDSITQIANSSLVALDEMWSTQGGGETLALIDTIGDGELSDPAMVVGEMETRITLADAIAGLPEREKIVVSLYYYEGLTLREIGEVLGVTESRVSQLHTKAVLRLRGRLSEDPS